MFSIEIFEGFVLTDQLDFHQPQLKIQDLDFKRRLSNTIFHSKTLSTL